MPKIYVSDENILSKEACKKIECHEDDNPSNRNESTNTGCTGCNYAEKYIEDNYDRVVGEDSVEEFVSLKDYESDVQDLKKELDVTKTLYEEIKCNCRLFQEEVQELKRKLEYANNLLLEKRR